MAKAFVPLAEDEKRPQQQFIAPLPAASSTSRRRRRDKIDPVEYELNMAVIEADEARKQPADRCNVGYAAVKRSFRGSP